MIQVILDTNILDRSPHRRNAEFHALQKLCDDGKIQIHLPDIVEKEFLVYRKKEIEEGVQSIAKGIKSLNKQKVSKQVQFSKLLNSWESQLDELKTQLINASYDEFSQWKENLKIQLHKIAAHHGEAVVQAYFEGGPPFKEIRSKVEFPDAFIWQSVLDILKQYKNVHFVSNNTKDFLKICKETSGVSLHPSLKEFLTSPQVKHLRIEQFTEQNFEVILAIIQQKESQILPKLIHRVYELFGTSHYLLDDLVDSTIHISGWGYAAKRDWKGQIDYEQAEHYGYGIISLPFVVTVEEFDISYDKTIYNASQLLQHDKVNDVVTLHVNEYFPLKLYTSAEIVLWTNDTDELETENISDIIDQASINVEQIYEIEADETKRQRFEDVI